MYTVELKRQNPCAYSLGNRSYGQPVAFHITSFSRHRGMGNDGKSSVSLTKFSVGGYDWAIRLYPDGYDQQHKDYISVYLELMSPNAKVRASWDLRLVDHRHGLCSSVRRSTEPKTFSRSDAIAKFAPQTPRFKKRSELEACGYLQDGRLTIVCIVDVFKQKPRVSEREPSSLRPKIPVPPSDILQHLGKLLETGEAADVTFCVEEQTIAAHRTVLAMRSPVFKAELCGSMREAQTQRVSVQGIQPPVFRALLHFIYTDTLPTMDDDLPGEDDDDRSELIRHLLVAADMYALDRLKLMCESMLCEDLNVQNVATVLALADQHHCSMLKDACIDFMSSSSTIVDDVVSTTGYEELRKNCPTVLVDALEKMLQCFKLNN